MEKSLDSELWQACAGGMVQMPLVNSKVFYFPQGHTEHTLTTVNFGALPRIPPLVLCRVASVKYLADPETDEVCARIKLFPVGNEEYDIDDDGVLGINISESNEKPNSFSKTLTQSDANNGGGFSVPRYCAETIFPRLDYTADPPVQNVIAKDVHGETWKFRHIYRGTPRRHLLTTGWSAFVNQKKLVAGDTVVFLRAENGDLCVGIRRSKRSGGGIGTESSPVWNSGSAGNYPNGDENSLMQKSFGNGILKEKGKVRPESVIESAFLAASGQPFEVVYYPRLGTPEFFVKAVSVKSAMRIHWCPGMRFKMAFETEDASRISWFVGTIGSVQVADPITWPNSSWRLLQVSWDEPELLQNVKSVNPWLIEVISTMSALHLSPFAPPKKKLRSPHCQDSAFDGRCRAPSFSGNFLERISPFCHPTHDITTGIQGARHAQIGVPLSGLHRNKKPHMGLYPFSFPQLDPCAKSHERIARGNVDSNEDISCLLSIGSSSQESEKICDDMKTPQLVLFGQPILTEQQISRARSQDTVSDYLPLFKQDLTKSLSNAKCFSKQDYLKTSHCKVFLESEDIGRTLDLSVLGSYENLFRRLEHMFGIERSEMLSHVFYHDSTGAVKQAGDERFSEFKKTAKRLTILMKPSTSITYRRLITGLQTVERGLDSANQAGPLTILA